jgi:hypothetical protein
MKMGEIDMENHPVILLEDLLETRFFCFDDEAL